MRENRACARLQDDQSAPENRRLSVAAIMKEAKQARLSVDCEIGYFVKHQTNRPVYEDPYELVAVTK